MILGFIKAESRKDIESSQFQFLRCNAGVIALELYLDRSNVSRILNDFFNQGLLIKKKGRPTTYVSKDIISEYYPYANVPNELLKNDLFSEYLHHTTNQEISFTDSLPIIGSEAEGSLFPVVKRFLPIFSYPKNVVKLVYVHGSFGSGKKQLIQAVFERGKQLGYFNSQDTITYISYSNQVMPEFTAFLEKKNASMIIAENLDNQAISDQAIYKMIHIMENLAHKKMNAPIFVYISSAAEDIQTFNKVTPFVLKIPPLQGRKTEEVIKIIFSILYRESKRLSKTIKLTKEYLSNLLVTGNNFHQIEQHLLYSISEANMFHSKRTSGEISLNEISVTSDEVKKTVASQIIAYYPDVITITYKQEPLDYLTISQTKKPNQLENHVLDKQEYFQKTLLLQNNNSQPEPIGLRTRQLQADLDSILKHGYLRGDPFLREKVKQQIINLCKEQESSWPLPSEYERKNEKITHLANKIYKLLTDNKETKKKETIFEKLYYLLNESYAMVENINIPIIICSQYLQLGLDYTNLFNLYKKKRNFFLFPVDKQTTQGKESISKFADDLYDLATEINRGQGVLLLTDPKIKTPLANYFFSKTKILTFCLSLHSFSILGSVLPLLNAKNASLISIIPNLIMNQKEESLYLKDTSLTTYSIRNTDKHLSDIEELFPESTFYQINEFLYKVVKKIANQLHFSLNNRLILEFIFHGNCILYQKKHQLLFYPALQLEKEKNNHSVALLIKKIIAETHNPLAADFNEVDIHVFAEVIKRFTSN